MNTLENKIKRMQYIQRHLMESAEIKREAMELCGEAIYKAAGIIAASFQSGKKVLLCGNGGSAADCQHMATEFVSRLTRDFIRPALPAIALTTDTSLLTAFTNDEGVEGVFERQVEALGKPGDTLIAISTSGGSANIQNALRAGSEFGLRTILLTGAGCKDMTLADANIVVPSTNTQYIQETHIAIEHVLCELVEGELFGKEINTIND